MFQNYSPDLRHPLDYSTFFQVFPSLLTGFHRTDFPAFKRYYGDAKTAFAPLHLFDFSRFGYHLRYIIFLYINSDRCTDLNDLDCLVRAILLKNPCSCGSRRLSRVPMLAFCAFDITTDPGRTNTTCLLRCIDIVPTGLNVNTSTKNNLSRLIVIPSTLAVYASGQHFY